MDSQEKKQFNLFKEELMKYEFIDGQLVEAVLNRFITPLTKRRFFNDTLKRKYYSFWFKILVKSKILEPRGMGFKVNDKK